MTMTTTYTTISTRQYTFTINLDQSHLPQNDDDRTRDVDAMYAFLNFIFSTFLYTLLLIYSYLRPMTTTTPTYDDDDQHKQEGDGNI